MREAKGLSREEVEEKLILGPGWIGRLEEGEIRPSLDFLLAVLDAIGASLGELVAAAGLPDQTTDAPLALDRDLAAEVDGDDLIVTFPYAKHDARYRLPGASIEAFEEVLEAMRDGLAKLSDGSDQDDPGIKRSAVASSFLIAIERWPQVNPSDIWNFVIARAYMDPFNHPAEFSRLDFGQSWKRAGGWALEEILVRKYQKPLAAHGIRIFIADGDEKERLVSRLKVADRLEADKADVFLTATPENDPVCFGIVHVKASFAERRTDDVPMSKALVDAGYFSPLWTMDGKSTPSADPFNRGELGKILDPDKDKDNRSAKRKDIEVDGYFSACFSYNANTAATPEDQDVAARIYVCDFSDVDDDHFVRETVEAWRRFDANATG
ncbi:MAG: helix-turn-helix domain-containing protein [Solirubrobacterales bacterium]|nr:helix-turn-helix domain-containing protein [Solirubrobacterales bacterium]